MIGIHFSINLPWRWGKKWRAPIHVCKDVPIRFLPNKNFQFEAVWLSPTTLLGLEVDTNWTHQDHGGITLGLTLVGLDVSVKIYDGRHWNDKAGRWYEDGEQEREWDDREAAE